MPKHANTNTPTIATVCAKLRYVRQLKGWTLADVEVKSYGKHKGNVIGSYERGQRTLSVKKLIELSRFYGVPITDFFGIPDQNDKSQALIDLLIERLHAQKG
jgi:transcriptional regulator with XRE-family HTH domain